VELTELQIYLVGLLASGLAIGLRLLSAKFGFELGKGVMTVVVGILSFILAMLFNPPALPPYVDFLQYIGAWLLLVTPYIGAATIIYNVILDKILDRLSLTTERFLPG
jgi:hypothetical protein